MCALSDPNATSQGGVPVDLGPESSFAKFPAEVLVDGEAFYLVHGRKGYLLLSRECPHQGGEVTDRGDAFACPDHGWRFEHTQGECVNGPLSRMLSYPVTIQDGRLVAELD